MFGLKNVSCKLTTEFSKLVLINGQLEISHQIPAVASQGSFLRDFHPKQSRYKH
jgi:hypothetical protein